MFESDWLKSIVSAVIAAAGTAFAFVLRTDRRLTRVEGAVDDMRKAAQKSAENGERLARVETSIDGVARTVDRLDEKIDRLMRK